MDKGSEKLRRYLLGDLSVEEAEEIEQTIILDEKFEAEVLEAEDILIEDHVEGTLSADEALKFQEGYLITPERYQNLEFVATLRRYSSERAISDRVHEAGSFWERLRSFLSNVPAVAYVICLLLFFGTVAAYFWLGRDEGLSKIQTKYSALNRQDFSDLGPYRSISSISVLPGSLRGTDSTVKISQGPSGDSILVRLGLPVEFTNYAHFDVRLKREGKKILSFDALSAYKSESSNELRLLLPVAILEKGLYQLEAIPTDRPESPITYAFDVE